MTGVWEQSPQRGPEAEPLVHTRGSGESFSSIFIQERPKRLVFKLKKTPTFGPWGRPPGPPIPGSTSGAHTHKTLANKIFKHTHILTNYTKLKPGLGAFYAIQLGNGSGLFYSSWDPHGAQFPLK